MLKVCLWLVGMLSGPDGRSRIRLSAAITLSVPTRLAVRYGRSPGRTRGKALAVGAVEVGTEIPVPCQADPTGACPLDHDRLDRPEASSAPTIAVAFYVWWSKFLHTFHRSANQLAARIVDTREVV